jgi:hypothetical protein
MEVDVEVVDSPINYKLLLGHNWTYAMTAIISSIFHTLCFPHDGKIMMIDQLSFVYASPSASIGSTIAVVDNSQLTTENTSVEMYSSLMGNFEFMALVHHIYAMSDRSISSERSVPFCTSYFNDPLTLSSSTMLCEG